MSEKQCKSCSEVKPASEYYKTGDTLCKECRRNGKTVGKVKENKELASQGLCRCMDCLIIKPASDFSKRGYRCRPCTQLERIRKIQEKNPEYVFQQKKDVTPDDPNNKVCTKCLVESSKDSFYKDKNAPDGLSYYCKSCLKKKSLIHYDRNKEVINEQAKEKRKELKETNPEEYEKLLEASRIAWHKRDKDASNKRSREWAKNNPDKSKAIKEKYVVKNYDKIKTKTKEYRQNNKARYSFLANQRRARQLQATPTWLTEEEKEDIYTFYVVREQFIDLFNVKYEVDHIIPLQGKTVCGLHVPWNLRVIESSINNSKKNFLFPELGLDLSAEYYRTEGRNFNEKNMH